MPGIMKSPSLPLVFGLIGALGMGAMFWIENRQLKARLAALEAGTGAGPAVRSAAGQGRAEGSSRALFSGKPEAAASSRSPGKKKENRGPLKAVQGRDGLFEVTDADGQVLLKARQTDLANLAVQAADILQAERIKYPGGPSWSPGQSAGPPDTQDASDQPTAWAPQQQDGGKEWLSLKYAKAVELGEITVYESYNPGALTRILALLPDGSEKVLWSGTTPADSGFIERVVKVPPGIRSDQIRLELDTSRVPGWNEIDAVEVTGRDGSRQWASEATASSYYGQNKGQPSAAAMENLRDIPGR